MGKPFNIKRRDTSPAIRFALIPTSVNLTGASVRFYMRARNGSVVVDAAAAVVPDAGTPTVEYAWQAGDTATAGLYEAEFEVTYADGKIETFPNDGYITIRMRDDIGAAGAATVPGAFGAGDWALVDSPSAGGDTLTLTISALPSNGGSAITALQYRVGGGAAQTLSGTGTGARQITVPATTLASVEVRAVNAVGNGAWSAAKTATPTVANTVPGAFGAGDWALVDSPSAGGDTLTLTISALPSNGGSAITALQYRVGGGAAQTLSGTGTGARQITVPAITLASVEVRAVNAVGNGAWSAAKTATPTVLVSLFDFELLNELGATTITSVPNLRVSIDGGANFFALGAVPGHTLTIARGADGKSLVISGWTGGVVPAGLRVHLKQAIPGEPNPGTGVSGVITELFAKRIGSPAPANTAQPGGFAISPTYYLTPVGVT